MRRLLVAAFVALTVLLVAPSAAQARTRLDARIDALMPAQLLTRNAVQLVEPARQRRARAIADLRHVASAGWGIAQILAFWWLWRSGTGAALRDALRRRTRNRLVHRLVFGAVLGALATIAAFPFAVMNYRVAFSAGLIRQEFAPWFVGYLGRIGFDALIGAVIVAGVLGLVERIRLWYLLVAAFLYVAALVAVTAQPLLPFGIPHKATPRDVVALNGRVASAAGAPGTPVVVIATSHIGDAMSMHPAGVGPTSRVVLGDVDLVHLTIPELANVLAHGDVHVRFEDLLRETLFGVTLFVLSCAIAVLLSDRVGFRRDDDALSRLALVGTLLGLVLVVTYPIYNAYVRNVEVRADREALRAVPDRVAAVRALVRFADVDLIPLCDRRSIRWYFDDQPPLGGRIAAINGTADPCPRGVERPAVAAFR